MIFIVQLAASLLVPDVPNEVTIQLMRQEFLTNKVVLRQADDVEGGTHSRELEKVEIQDYPTGSSNAGVVQ